MSPHVFRLLPRLNIGTPLDYVLSRQICRSQSELNVGCNICFTVRNGIPREIFNLMLLQVRRRGPVMFSSQIGSQRQTSQSCDISILGPTHGLRSFETHALIYTDLFTSMDASLCSTLLSCQDNAPDLAQCPARRPPPILVLDLQQPSQLLERRQ